MKWDAQNYYTRKSRRVWEESGQGLFQGPIPKFATRTERANIYVSNIIDLWINFCELILRTSLKWNPNDNQTY
jgi:hypothetical protein